MKVGTPFGEFPFEYRRIERRDDGVAIIGSVAGIESSVVFGQDDALRAAKLLAVPAGLAMVLLARSRRR